jgi:hypothetical protein
MLFFLEIMQLLVEETNRYYHQYLDTLDEGCSPLPDVTVQEMYLFLSVTVLLPKRQTGRLLVPPTGTVFMAFYRNTLKRDRFFHILRFLNFSDNKPKPDKADGRWTKIMTGYGKWKCATATMTATHATMTGITTEIENLGHKLYMDNSFSSPDLFDDLHIKAINCCGTVRPN